MDLRKAKRIQELRCGRVMHSWRRISEIICDEFPDEDLALSGNQLHGVELCQEAMITLHGVNRIQDLSDSVRDRWDS